MIIATFNVWHGLAERKPLRFREFESEARRSQRWDLALSALNSLDPDLIFLQELNPLAKKSKDLKDILGGEVWGHVDQSGVRAFGCGFPLNLSTGLATVARKQVRQARLREDSVSIPEFVQLSGRPFVSGERFSFQLKEVRGAQFHSLWTKEFGRILAVNAHLHHGFERFPPLMDLIAKFVQSGRISQESADALGHRLDSARDRRVREVDAILSVVENVSKIHDGVVIAGDFNSTDQGVAYQNLLLNGFKDLSLSYGRAEPTWDPTSNKVNHELQESFDFPLPTFGNPEFQRLYREFDALPRRIDFLFARGSLLAHAPKRVATFGRADEVGFAASDHYGVFAEWA